MIASLVVCTYTGAAVGATGAGVGATGAGVGATGATVTVALHFGGGPV